ncbi:helix-turn-helix domain-containing protein [Litoribrevibacter albus]|uniref:Uncharacterized protein n=1 Tax=Litoribrevibacter albus TaxID=1473156 RepID=A0AA37W6N9_9GAMM|nr:helix-turn-helix domain-containing protein [Litoribrevibacter albus]GLQ31720.1 hypothetical protein GCM10007876_21990 [Litoribrevibacter albus]
MIKALLNYKFGCLGPEEKFFILLFLMRFEEIKEGGLGVKAISKLLGVTDRVVSGALRYLVDEGLLEKCRAHKAPDRIFVSYALQDDLYRIKKTDCSVPLESFVIEIAQDTYTDKTHKLKLANRLLLLVLFINADENGVVRNLGVADLAKLTGMSRDRLKSQLEKLMDLEYIRFFTPGVTGTHLFGVAKGAYFLNLDHDSFICSIKPQQVLVLQLDEDTWNIRNTKEWSFFRIGYELRLLKERLKEKFPDEDQQLDAFAKEFKIRTKMLGTNSSFQSLTEDEARALLAFFQDKPVGGRIVRYFCYKLDVLVSQLLTESWGVLNDCPNSVSLNSSRCIKEHESAKKIMGTIKSEFFPLKPKAETSETQVNVLIDYVFYLVLRRACLIKSLLEEKGLVSPVGKRYQVLTHHNQDYLVFFSYSGSPNSKDCDTKFFLKTGVLPSEEQELKKESLYLYRLLSRPVKKVDRFPKKGP